MRWVTEKEQVAHVAANYKRQYFTGGAWASILNGVDTEEIYKKLRSVADLGTAEDVRAITGNDSWIGQMCSECGDLCVEYLEVGEPPEDYGSRAVFLCRDCALSIARHVPVVTP